MLYIIVNLYDLQWLLVNGMPKFSRIMAQYQSKFTNSPKLNKIYYNNRNLKLLLNLLRPVHSFYITNFHKKVGVFGCHLFVIF